MEIIRNNYPGDDSMSPLYFSVDSTAGWYELMSDPVGGQKRNHLPVEIVSDDLPPVATGGCLALEKRLVWW
ncbi:MAG: hypothetical protein U9R25_19495 [Chloroflexota bacterium]|nr:hypothetical protein [Chloroflexota bacterium]